MSVPKSKEIKKWNHFEFSRSRLFLSIDVRVMGATMDWMVREIEVVEVREMGLGVRGIVRI